MVSTEDNRANGNANGVNSTAGSTESGKILNYFAIGAMMNPVSVKNRHLNLERNAPAMPAQLLDHKLVFFGLSGFAEVVPCPGTTLHGVVYRQVPTEDMKELDHIERDYIRKTAKAILYPPNSNPQDPKSFLEDVTVYCREADVERGSHIDKPPSERYLEIMLNGCRYYGVEPNYIKHLEQHECTPRPSPDEYFSFPVQDGAMERTMTRQQAHEQGNGQGDNPLWICSNGRVIQLCEDNDSPFFREFCKTMSTYGKDVEMFMARVQYDPKYGNPQSIEEISPEESAYREHGFCQYMQGINKLDRWQVIAKMVRSRK